ncbi:MAG: hypothetical protein AAGF54_17730, partial [Pseudomonadota bacterium]
DEEIFEKYGTSNPRSKKQLTVVAVIDDGIPFAHRHFRDQSGDKSRVEFCWLQSVERRSDDREPTVTYGREYTRNDIDRLLNDYGEDEDFLYYKSGALQDQGDHGSVLDRHATHGAHVMDQACGYSTDRGERVRDEVRIVAVQLPNNLVADTSSFAKDAYILSAFHYIFNRADIIASEEGYDIENLRLVINLSFGFSGGSLDGRTDLEAAINDLVSFRRKLGKPTALVVPSGNTFLSQLYGEISEQDFTSERFTFDWHVQPNDGTSSYIEIWFPREFNPVDYSVKITSPSGNILSEIVIEQKDVNSADQGDYIRAVIFSPTDKKETAIGTQTIDRNIFDRNAPQMFTRWRVAIALAPTEPRDDSLEAAQSGLWSVSIERKSEASSLENGVIDIRVQRDENFGLDFNGARQSYLLDEKYRLFNEYGTFEEFDPPRSDIDNFSHVKRFGTLNGLASGELSIIVGGARPSGQTDWKIDRSEPSLFSSAGRLNSSRPAPQVDCAALADRSTILPGVMAAGTRSGSCSQLQGTSSAAPFVACAIAEAFTIASDDDVLEAEAGNYLELITKNSGGLDTEPVDVDNIFDGRDSAFKLAMKTRMGEYLILRKQRLIT